MQEPGQSPMGANLKLRLFGGFALSGAGREIPVPSNRARALLAFLACEAGKLHAREKLAALLWGDRFDEQARQSLRQTLSGLRKCLGPDVLTTDRNDVRLAVSFASDVQEFRALIERNELQQAIALYRDELLAGFALAEKSFTDWLVAERAQLRNLALATIETLMRQEQANSDPAPRLAYGRRALAIEPFHEESHRQILRALAEAGHRNDALIHYRQFEQALRGELGVRPEPATRAVFDAICSGAMDANTTSSPDVGAASVLDRAAKPGIAVLPFDDIAGDAMTARIAGGITEDIVTDLARFRDLDVIARNSSASYTQKPIDIRRMGRELKVDYVLLGTIQRHGRQIRVTAQLLDVATGATLWSDRWDRPIKDIFAVQAEIAEAVAVTIGGMGGSAAIMAAEIDKARRRPPESLTAYDHYLLANEGRSRFTGASIAAGLVAANRAIALEPTLGRAYVARAWLNYIAAHHGADLETALAGMEADATHAVALDPYDAEARVALAFYLNCRGRFEECEAQIEIALQANPTNAQVLAVAAAMRAWGGHPDEAAAMADKVLRLDPLMTPENLNCIKDAYYLSRRFDKVIEVVSRIPPEARGKGARLMLTLSHALLGQTSEAGRARAALLAKYPAISAELLLNQDWRCARAEEEELFLQGFRAADLRLCASATELAGIADPRRLHECTV